MNVLIITAVGGFLPKFLMQDVQLLKDRGHVIHYATNFNNLIYECDIEDLEAMGIQCHMIAIAKSPVHIFKGIKALIQLIDIVKKNKIDAVYLHNPMGGVLGRLLTVWKKELYVIYTSHGFHFYHGAPFVNWLMYYPVEFLLAKRTNQLVTINEEDEKIAKKFKLRECGASTKISGVGLDSKRFYYNPEIRGTLRRKYRVGESEFVFLSVGELNNNKNHAVIIEAFAKCNYDKAKLYICGEGSNRKKLQKLINKLGLEKKIKLLGYQIQIEDFYRLADCFVFPSKREGLGMASVEAMACGLPLIVADNRGTREYAFNNSIVCASDDAEGFSKAMTFMIRNTLAREKMVKESLEIVPRFYREEIKESMDRVFERMREIVESKE